MREIMKKFISTVAVLLLTLSVACAKSDRPVKVTELPVAAQTFLKSYFPDVAVSFAKLDDEFVYKEYEVMLADGSKVEFNGDGEWKNVDCKAYAVPAGIIPEQIKAYVERTYPGAKIMQIDRDRRDYEVSLSNRLELTFDKRFNLVDIDD
jgi:hypothetical protein